MFIYFDDGNHKAFIWLVALCVNFSNIVLLQDSIQRVLLSLTVQFSKSRHLPDKCRFMTILHFFIKLLMQELHGQMGRSLAFILRHVIHVATQCIEVTMSSVRYQIKLIIIRIIWKSWWTVLCKHEVSLKLLWFQLILYCQAMNLKVDYTFLNL